MNRYLKEIILLELASSFSVWFSHTSFDLVKVFKLKKKEILQILFSIIVFTTLFSSSLVPTWADSLSLNKKNFILGDTIVVSGKVTNTQGGFIGLQILNPSKSDIVTIDQFLPQKDGSFSKSYKVQGYKWSEQGIYTLKIAYNENILEENFSFSNSVSTPSTELPISEENPPENVMVPISENQTFDLKKRVPGFPDPYKSPNYYYERYSKDPGYKVWFDATFPSFLISDVVGYKPTHILGFPDEDNSPWSYLNRYQTEENYQDWFDSQFPDKSIYQVLGYDASSFQKVPEWVRITAQWWSSGLVEDFEFLNGISFLISEQILIIPENQEVKNDGIQNVPSWVKQTAGWWADGKIDEIEFLKGLQFLIANGIIIV